MRGAKVPSGAGGSGRARGARRASQRGAFLVQALVLLTLLGYASATLLRVALARYATVHKAHSAERDRLLLRSAEVLVRSCLDRTPFSRASCDLAVARACLPLTVEGRPVEVAASGKPPLCGLSVVLSPPR